MNYASHLALTNFSQVVKPVEPQELEMFMNSQDTSLPLAEVILIAGAVLAFITFIILKIRKKHKAS